jgi:hypothetical protein
MYSMIMIKSNEAFADYTDSSHPLFKGFRYDAVFLWFDMMSKSVICCCVAFLGRTKAKTGPAYYHGYVILCVLLVLSGALLVVNHRTKPCSLDSINAVRHFTLVWSLLSCSLGILVSLVRDKVMGLSILYILLAVGLMTYSFVLYRRASSKHGEGQHIVVSGVEEAFGLNHNVSAGYGTGSPKVNVMSVTRGSPLAGQ